MSVMAALRKYEEQFPVSFLGLIVGASLGLLGVGIALYTLLSSPKPEVVYEVISESDVLDIRRPLDALQVLFQGEDLQDRQLNLRIIGLRVFNNGDTDVLPGHYDQRLPWGVRVRPGRIIEARLTTSNSAYLDSSLQPRLVSDTTVVFEKVIFERGRFFVLELLVVHPTSRKPSLTPLGKIAGIEELAVRDVVAGQGAETVLGRSFRGPILVQLIRGTGYFVGAILVFVVVGFVIAGGSSLVNRWRRRSRRREVSRVLGKHPEWLEQGELVVEVYEAAGLPGLQELKELVEKRDTLLSERAFAEARARHFERDGEDSGVSVQFERRRIPMELRNRVVTDERVVEVVDGEVAVRREFRDVLEGLIAALSAADSRK